MDYLALWLLFFIKSRNAFFWNGGEKQPWEPANPGEVNLNLTHKIKNTGITLKKKRACALNSVIHGMM